MGVLRWSYFFLGGLKYGCSSVLSLCTLSPSNRSIPMTLIICTLILPSSCFSMGLWARTCMPPGYLPAAVSPAQRPTDHLSTSSLIYQLAQQFRHLPFPQLFICCPSPPNPPQPCTHCQVLLHLLHCLDPPVCPIPTTLFLI